MSSLRPDSNTRRRVMAEINVVPYIDVMLVLVVILMVSAPFVEPSVVNLPTVAKASKAPDRVISVIVKADGSLSMKEGGRVNDTDMPALVDAVRRAESAAGQPVPVVISADRDVKYDRVIAVMKSLQKANVERVGLALQVDAGK
ncbi:biopolymer transporter ExbD [Mesosutterella sp. OilRF-GAM-744-9]|uniref:Biopolymer transporter ExbD n=1 Tax=Mesosutterella porci TaxID=2915351 RepID=A0ABS9MRM8_9BURK|nr:biopolymer transporter ExbD [Mesosutterella sp. oilRF-744-WT-GAM-9]MCG5031291.1 biopolymer transporter ExbD [Mesosutterella sp. oilRF-744-WT-GAM-9]MCI6530982.1 biopolymer transporter ExbD [Mesosutterella sp.]